MPEADRALTVPDSQDRLLMWVGVGAMGLVVLFAAILLFILPEYTPRWVLTGGAAAGAGALLYALTAGGRIRLARIAFTVSVFAIATLLSIIGGGTVVPAFWAYLIVVLLATLTLGWRGGIWIGAACIAAGLGIAVLEANGSLAGGTVQHTPFTRWLTLILLLTLLLALYHLVESRQKGALRHAAELLRERERAEEQLRILADRLAIAAEASQIAVWDYDIASGMIYADARLRELYGFPGSGAVVVTREELLSRIHPDDLQAVMNVRHLDRFTFRIVRPDGEERRLRGSVAILSDAGGTPVRMVGANLDITASARAQDERRVLLHDLGERVKELTLLRQVSRLLQTDRTPDAALMQELVELIPAAFQFPADCEALVVAGELTAQTAGFRESTLSLRSTFGTGESSGQICVVYVNEQLPSSTPFLEEERALLHSLGEMLSRYLEHHQAVQALRQREEEFRVIFNGAAMGIALLDSEGRPLAANPALQHFLGYDARELARMTFAEFTHPDDVSKDLSAYASLVAGHRDSYQMEKRYIRKDGQHVWGRLTVSAVRSPQAQPRLFVGMVEDITARKHADEEKLRLESQLRQSQKMEAMGLLAGGVAHDFNNLITIISGYSNLLLANLEEESDMQEMIAEIRDAGARAGSLTRQLLAFSRRAVYQPAVLDPNALIRDMEKMLSRLIGEDIQLTTELNDGVAHVKADHNLLEQALVNLTVNARDAIRGSGGKITITTLEVELDELHTMNSGIPRPGRYVMISVSDNGSGMDEDTLARIFEPFFTTKERDKGSGLGLSMVYGFVKQCGGHVHVTSLPGHGTTVRLFLPAAAAPLTRDRETAASDSLERGDEHVLLVEDDDAVRALTRHILTQCGYTVWEYANPVHAAAVPDSRLRAVKLLLTDVVMLELSGRQLADQLRIRAPWMKVVYMSGYTDDAMVRHGVWEESVHFVQKPFTPKVLARKVREALDGI